MKMEFKLEVKLIIVYEEWFLGLFKKDIVFFVIFLICIVF